MPVSHRYRSLLAVFAVVLVIAGCSAAGGPVSTPTRQTGAPGGEMTPLPADLPCPRRDLELWLQKSSDVIVEYGQLLNTSLVTAPNLLGPTVDQLDRLRSMIENAAPPPCAVDHQDMILNMMDESILSLTRYASGQPIELGTFATVSNAALDNIRNRKTELSVLYVNMP